MFGLVWQNQGGFILPGLWVWICFASRGKHANLLPQKSAMFANPAFVLAFSTQHCHFRYGFRQPLWNSYPSLAVSCKELLRPPVARRIVNRSFHDSFPGYQVAYNTTGFTVLLRVPAVRSKIFPDVKSEVRLFAGQSTWNSSARLTGCNQVPMDCPPDRVSAV